MTHRQRLGKSAERWLSVPAADLKTPLVVGYGQTPDAKTASTRKKKTPTITHKSEVTLLESFSNHNKQTDLKVLERTAAFMIHIHI